MKVKGGGPRQLKRMNDGPGIMLPSEPELWNAINKRPRDLKPCRLKLSSTSFFAYGVS